MPTPDPYLTAEELRERRPDRLTAATDATLESWVAVFEDLAERYLGAAYREREATYTGRPDRGWLELPHRQVTAATVADEDDNALVVDELEVERGRIGLRSWTFGQLTATYTHGYTTPTEMLLTACAMWVERMVVQDQSGQSRDTLSFAADGGTTRYSTPDPSNGRPTGFLQVDNLLNLMRNERPMVF